MRRAAAIALAVALVLAIAGAVAAWQGRSRRAVRREAQALTAGDAEKGRAAISGRGCGACHEVPGVAGAAGRVGPPLAGVATRAYLAGRLPNTPENLVRWIRAPREVDPRTAMPDLGIAEGEARDIAAYLYTLR